jgi:hypothetical protein
LGWGAPARRDPKAREVDLSVSPVMRQVEDAIDRARAGCGAVGNGGIRKEMPGDVEPAASDDFFGRARRVVRVDARGKLYQVATADHPGDGRPGCLGAED